MTIEEMSNLKDLELIKMIKNEKTTEDEYQKAYSTIYNRYEKQIHKNWHTLEKQMGYSKLVEAMKDEYYDEAQEAFCKAIQKVNIDKIYDEKWKLVGYTNFYLKNVRTKLIRQIRKQNQITKSTSTISMAVNENDESNTIDFDVEKAYYEKEGYKLNPEYVFFLQANEDILKQKIDLCYSQWTDEEKQIFNYLKSGKKKTEISKIMKISPIKVINTTKNMYSDIKYSMEV